MRVSIDSMNELTIEAETSFEMDFLEKNFRNAQMDYYRMEMTCDSAHGELVFRRDAASVRAGKEVSA